MASATEKRHSRDPFYLGMALFSLAVVLFGFSRSFFFQDYFEFPAIPVHLTVHGAVLTAWFVLACAQPLLIKNQNPRLHRRLGMAGMFIAIGVVASGVWTVAMRDFPTIDEFPARASGNLASLFMFAFCVIAGYRFRRKPEHHRRLMLMASIPILAPALDRTARIPFLNEFFGKLLYWFPDVPEVAFAFLAFLTLLFLVVARDLISVRRVHIGTWLGLAAILVAAPAATAIIMSTGSWVAFVKWAG